MKSTAKSLLLLTIMIFLAVGCAQTPDEETFEPEITPTPTPRVTPTPEPEIPIDPLPECFHFWSLPDCHTPIFCLDCGEIGGEPTPHEFTEANFQQPAICKLCGDIYGGVLEPNFTALGFEINTTPGRWVDFHTVTNLDSETETVGTVILLHIDIFETAPDYPRKVGYEFIRARLMMIFDDEAAASYGYKYVIGHVDYYSMSLTDPSVPFEYLLESNYEGFKISNRTINFHGQEREYFVRYEEIRSAWAEGVAYVEREYTFLVPAGYDGIVIYLSSAANWTEYESRIMSDNIDENTLFFRLTTQTT